MSPRIVITTHDFITLCWFCCHLYEMSVPACQFIYVILAADIEFWTKSVSLFRCALIYLSLNWHCSLIFYVSSHFPGSTKFVVSETLHLEYHTSNMFALWFTLITCLLMLIQGNNRLSSSWVYIFSAFILSRKVLHTYRYYGTFPPIFLCARNVQYSGVNWNAFSRGVRCWAQDLPFILGE